MQPMKRFKNLEMNLKKLLEFSINGKINIKN